MRDQRADSRTRETSARGGRTPAWDVLGVFGLSLALYAATAAPSVATIFDDSLEFQVVLSTLNIAHPSGYPLYTLLGKLATLLIPWRDPAGRANLFSALTAALAVGLLYLAARRLVGSRPAAATAAAVFALSPAWWSQATLAEVYALHGLLMAAFIYMLLRWEAGARGQAGLTAAAAIFGLGLAHHRMIVLLAPAALVFIAWAERGLLRAPRRWVAPALAGLAPLLLYVYLPIRGQAVDSLDGTFTPTVAGTLDWIAARDYGVFLTGNPFAVQRDVGFFVGLFFGQLAALPLLAALMGLAVGWRFGLRRYLFLLLATAAQIAFAVAYKAQDIEVFFIPAFMLVALWSAIGLAPAFDAAQAWAARWGRGLRLPSRFAGWALRGVALALALVVLAEPLHAAQRDWAARDRSATWSVYDTGQDMLAHVAADGRVVGLLGETTLLRYFRDVLGQRRDVTVIAADREAERLAAVDAALADRAAVYLTRDLPGAAARYSLDAAGPLIAVSPKAVPTAAPAGRPVAPGILLADIQIALRAAHAGPIARITPTWVAAAPIREELKVSARLLDAAGRQLAQDDRVPVHFTYPTTAWVVGETVRDSYDLPLPRAEAPAPYRVLLIWYRAADGGEVGRVETPLALPGR